VSKKGVKASPSQIMCPRTISTKEPFQQLLVENFLRQSSAAGVPMKSEAVWFF